MLPSEVLSGQKCRKQTLGSESECWIIGIQHRGLNPEAGRERHMEVSESEANDRDAESCGRPGGRKGTWWHL